MLCGDKYLKDVFFETLLFVLSSENENRIRISPIIIEGSHISSHFCVIIRDPNSHSIAKEICTRLSRKITDQWEYQGHYIGISLVSVIMQHYGGLLNIQPLEPNGNEFQLFFPSKLIETS